VGAAVASAAAASGAAPPAVRLTPCVVAGEAARCGTFVVPENRQHPGGRRIGLNVVVVPARRRPALPDAFTFLAGGPGSAATLQTGWVARTFGAVNARRDIVLVDQRGTGSSHPLACVVPAHPPRTAAQSRAFAASCLRSLHADVRQFGTRTAMDDLDALRAALGYRTLDVYGASYGATAAQVFLQRHPSSVRTLVLDGSTALDVPFYGRFAANAQAALDRVAARCRASAPCRRAFPQWRADFTRLVRAWDEHPALTRTGETTSGAGLAGVVQSMLLSAGTAAEIPLVVSRAAAGDYAPLNRNVQSGQGSLDLMFYSIWCNEPWVGLDVHGPWGTDFDSTTESALAFHRGVCKYVPKRAEPAADWTLPNSRVPLLVLAGGADPQDPIGNMPHLARAFPDSRAIVVPGYGHVVAPFGCLGAVVSRFVEAGTARGLATGCVRAIAPPAFLLR
jgi:pimeloyl-ACP methyl ester carboxylesterase